MAGLSSFFRRLFGLSKATATVPTFHSPLFLEGDRVFLRSVKNEILSAPLQKNARIPLRESSVPSNDIIGKSPGFDFRAQNGIRFKVTHPSLEQYVRLTPRKVTPIYAHDANLIVSLLDLTVPHHSNISPDSPPLEILEAGTGHGSLTLHLARAIQAANPGPPTLPPPSFRQLEKNGTTIKSLSPDPEWDSYLRRRKAIIHTVDVSPSFSVHAEKLIRGFHRGIYASNINFYVAHLRDWISSQLNDHTRQKQVPFISAALLDLPSAHLLLEEVSQILHPNAPLTVFFPSVTQVGDCISEIRSKNIPLRLDQTLELGMGISNGRVWDVRLADIRNRSTDSGKSGTKSKAISPKTAAGLNASDTADDESTSSTISSVSEDTLVDESDARTVVSPTEEEIAALAQRQDPDASKDRQVLVCRPKVGERIVGGGFVALFRKI